jgi:hypothetical protein
MIPIFLFISGILCHLLPILFIANIWLQFYFISTFIWANLAHLMIGMSIILAKININFSQNNQHSDYQVSQIRPYVIKKEANIGNK